MSRVACIFFPYLYAGWARRKHPWLGRQPLVIFREGRVTGVSPELRGYGLEGLPVAEAKGKCPDAFFLAYDEPLYKGACNRYLEALTRVSPIIEPVSDEECFFDLTGSSTEKEIAKLKTSLGPDRSWGPVLVGIGRNKFVARLLARAFWQAGSIGDSGFYCLETAPGQEKYFMKTVPITMDWLLPPKVLDALSRLGFKSYGELQDLRLDELVEMLGEHGYTVYRHGRGLDDTPLVNLYPPGKLALAFGLEGETESRGVIARVLRESARVLASLLYSRRKGCRFVKLALASEEDTCEEGRLVPWGYREERKLYEVLVLLLDKLTLTGPVVGVRVEVSSLYDWELAEQDLFDLKPRPRHDLTAVALALNEKYPGMISRGVKIGRREEVLSFWDPWRFSGETR
ncbi:DNA polymerase Y family protein [Syntrophothermus lipocalidus]|nr:hypothetical protein [Syntrophothermus lipocalidus]HOV43540.1 hypothetical protein [Syntrophothermus lipocalidus]